MRHLLENNLLIFQFNSAFDDFQSFDDLIHDSHCTARLKNEWLKYNRFTRLKMLEKQLSAFCGLRCLFVQNNSL